MIPSKSNAAETIDARTPNSAIDHVGLLAAGVSGHWTLEVSEALDGSRRFVELDGPSAYVHFQIDSLDVLRRAFEFLVHRPAPSQTWTEDKSSIVLGRLGSLRVSLAWDVEQPLRCFLSVGTTGDVVRLTFDGKDVDEISAALRQIVSELDGDEAERQ